MAATMFAGDSISAALAECFVTIDGKRYNFAHAISLEASAEKNKTEVPILGQVAKGNKPSGMTYSGSMTLHYNQSIFRKLLYDYAETGVDTYFDIQVVNEDKGSSAGRQEIILVNCNLDGGILAKFDADAELLDEDVDFTYERFELVKEFTPLTAVGTVPKG